MIPQSLAPAARSAYRAVLRSARITFSGDEMRHAQFVTVLRNTFASPTLSIPGKVTPPPLEGDIPDPASEPELRKRIQEWNDVAKFLRENVVQGRLDDKTGSYKLRVTKDTELGDNDEMKPPPALPNTPFPNRNKARQVQMPCASQQ